MSTSQSNVTMWITHLLLVNYLWNTIYPMSHYHSIEGTFIWNTPLGCGIASPSEMDDLSRVDCTREIISFRDFLFESRSGITSTLKEMISDRNCQINEILTLRRTFDKHRSPLHYEVTEIQIQTLLQDIKRLKGYLQLNKLGKQDNAKINIEKAKSVPIDTFIKFNRAGFAPCIWHNEKTGSMYYYRKSNKVKCFGCQKSGDVIDVIKEIRKCSFIEAVNILQS